ncbi:glucan endo-1,3-beta-glucosidase 1 [Tanacetum coccineum]
MGWIRSLLRKLVGLLKETGWPSKGDSKEPYATVDNADTYNTNLIKYIFDRSGIPFHPEYTSSVYICELFNEDLRSSPVSEANWGLFYANSTPVYLLHVSRSGEFLANVWYIINHNMVTILELG